MGDIYSLADSFLLIASMSNKKLQKLCYYAKAWYLALYDENLISNQFQAWVHGPVCAELYSKYKDYGFDDIPKLAFTTNVPEEFKEFAKKVYITYGDLSGDELEELTHQEQPWLNARNGLKPWEGSKNVILEDDMKSYYRSIMES